MKTISRVYDSYAQARAAVADLEKAGIGTDDISVVANKHVSAEYADVEDVSEIPADAAKGAGIGGAIGGGAGLLAGIGLLAIPGLGPVIAAGWLAATAVGVAAGAATGGIVGALVGAGIDHQHAEVYSESIRRGSTLVTARVLDEEAVGIERILGSHRPVDLRCGPPTTPRKAGRSSIPRRRPTGPTRPRSTACVRIGRLPEETLPPARLRRGRAWVCHHHPVSTRQRVQ